MLVRKIHKFELKTCKFSKFRDELSANELSLHTRHAHLSILLNDKDESNVRIVFNTVDGLREVISSIWGATEKRLFLPGGDFVPMESVAALTLE